MALYPDAIVDYVLEQLTYEGSAGVTWDSLWLIVGERYPVDEMYKEVIYSWVKENVNIEHLDGSGQILKEAPTSLTDAQGGLVKVKDEYQWITLTGAPMKNNSVGNAAFQLLSVIANSRSEGIDSQKLIQVTKQDKRSLTSRIKKIQHLIRKIQITRNGRVLQLFFLIKNFDENCINSLAIPSKDSGLTIQIDELKEKISRATRDAKSGLRQITDLRRELEMDKTPRLSVVFRSAVNYLEAVGCVSKVLVVSPVSPTVRIRAIKFVKEYTTNKFIEDVEAAEDEDDFNDIVIDEQLKEMDDEEGSASLKNMADLQVVESIENIKPAPGFNRFYPVQSQMFELIDKKGTAGISTNELEEKIFGREYKKLFDRLVEYYSSGKFISNMANYGIIRHYDFKGRVKFYRYLSRANLLKLSSQPVDPLGSTLPPLVLPKLPIGELSSKVYSPLISNPVAVKRGGKTEIEWFATGEFSIAKKNDNAPIEDAPRRKRGRPRKDEARTEPEVKKRVRRPTKVSALEMPPTVIEIIEPAVGNGPLVLSDIQGHSFKSIERLSAILRVMEDHDGVVKNDFLFREEVNEELEFAMDKRTYANDISSLVAQQKVKKEKLTLDNGNTIELLISANATSDDIEHLKRMMGKTGKKQVTAIKKYEELNTDVDFFDMELRETFVAVEEKKQKSSVPKKVLPKGSRLQVKKAAPKVHPKEKSMKQEIDPELESQNLTESLEENFDEFLQRKRKRAKLEKLEKYKNGRKRRSGQLDSEGMMKLFKTVIICKTLNQNQIDWLKISRLEYFEGIKPEDLRSRWPKVRMMMGPNGIQVARRKWKRILLHELRQGNITPESVEDLDLETMLTIWTNDVGPMGTFEDTGERLYVNIEDNFEHYNFVKAETANTNAQYDNNSMVQRENHLVGQVYTYSENEAPLEHQVTNDDLIRTIITAIVVSGQKFDLKKLSVLERFTKEEVDAVFLQMTKKREIVMSGDCKVQLGDRMNSILEGNSYDFSLEKVSKFQRVLKELCQYNKGLVMDPVFDNYFMVPILELIKDNAINLTRVDYYRKEVLSGYEARTLERDKLDCDIILSKNSSGEIRDLGESAVPVPHGKPCSRIWINIQGEINRPIWIKLLRTVLVTILSHPGITMRGIYEAMTPLLSLDEVQLIVKWLADAKSVKMGVMDGYWVEPQWYMVI